MRSVTPSRGRGAVIVGAVLARLLVACCLVAGCTSGGLKNGVYRGDGFAFRFGEPGGGWERLEAAPAAIAYRNEQSRASMMVNARCGEDGDDVPLIALTNHLFLMFTDRQIVTQEVIPFDDREAMHTVMNAKLDGVPMTYDVWVLKKDGCVYDLLYLAPEATFDGAHASFDGLVRGFATVDPHDD
ncbi:MAG: hypothetical protein RIF41_32660 [Polyangiaceae bacterium]